MSNIQTGAERMPHDLSHLGFLAGQIGRLITISTTPVIAGDSFEMDAVGALRLSPLRRGLAIDSTVDIFTFYVPHRHVYGEQWIKFMKDGVNATPLPTVNTTGYIEHAAFLGTINPDTNKIPKHLFQGYLNIYNNYFKAPWMHDRTEANPNFFFQAEDGIRYLTVTGVQTCALPIFGQFAVSIGLIICTAVVYSQTVYAQTSDPGYRRDGILQVEGIGRRQIVPIQQALISEIERVPGVRSAATTTIGVATQNSTNDGVLVPGSQQPINIGTYQIDYKFFDTMGIRLIAGRTFDQNRPMDDATVPFPVDPAAQRAIIARGGINVVINEAAARKLGWRNPADAVGKTVRAGIFGQDYGFVPINIIGVVQDSRFRSIREPLDEIMFRIDTRAGNQMEVRPDGSADPQAVRTGVEAAWKRLIHDAPFSARFSEEIITDLYKAETARAKVFAG